MSYIDLVKASTCETCRNGCECSGPGAGCGHFGCWGHEALEADGACPEAQRIRASKEYRSIFARRSAV